VIFNQETWVNRQVFWYFNVYPHSPGVNEFEKECAFKIGTDAR